MGVGRSALLSFVLLSLGLHGHSVALGSIDETQLVIELSNNVKMPLVGLGIGNMDSMRIQEIFPSAIEAQYRLFDTARASYNEHIVRNQLIEVSQKSNKDVFDETQIVTKVWYTHLGYNRTKLSVYQSLSELGPNTKTHLLLHWPRCDDRIQWMNCEEEEENLPSNLKRVGPSPLLNKNGENAAWKGSWKALEEMYLAEDRILSIGVSNFNSKDMQELVQESRITPHLYQGNIEWLFTEPQLVEILRVNNIVFQAYNVMHAIFSQLPDRPWARDHLERISLDLSTKDFIVSWPRLIIAFLAQQNISVVIRASDEKHLRENSPLSIHRAPFLNQVQIMEMKEILQTLAHGKDVPQPRKVELEPNHQPVQATFRNLLQEGIDIFWIHEKTGEHINIGTEFQPGHEKTIKTFPGHRFVAKLLDGLEIPLHVSHDVQAENIFHLEL